MKHLHRVVLGTGPGVFEDEDDYVRDRVLPDVENWISFSAVEHQNVAIYVVPLNDDGEIVDRGDMTFSFEMLERIQSFNIAPTTNFRIRVDGGDRAEFVVDTESGQGQPNKKILYRSRGIIAALRLHTFADIPGDVSQLAILFSWE